jgi:uncharacterized cupin superfamily protein
MEMSPGVFVSRTSTGEWEPDTDPPGEVQVLCSGVGLQAGLWRPVQGATPEPVRWISPAGEVLVVLEGTATVEIEGGPTLELAVGDIASLPRMP